MTDVLPEKIVNRMDKKGFVTLEIEWIYKNSDEFIKELRNSAEKFGINAEKVVSSFQREIHRNELKQGSIYWRIFVSGRWIDLLKSDVSTLSKYNLERI